MQTSLLMGLRMRWGMHTIVALVLLALLAGWALGQGKPSVEERLQKVRRVVKVIDLDSSIPRVPALIAREEAYEKLLDKLAQIGPSNPDMVPKLLNEARDIKLAALKDLNEILKRHKGKHVGLTEAQIYERLRKRFHNVQYEDEWLVNILDDIEDACSVNVEMDARVYKFDSVTFDFESTSARAMLQMMADELEFKWIVRGDTLYVFKERNEVLFGKRYERTRKKALKARGKGAKK